jgi:hypothetical protein
MICSEFASVGTLILNPVLVVPVNAPLLKVGLISNPTNTSLFALADNIGIKLVPLAIVLDAVTTEANVLLPDIVCIVSKVTNDPVRDDVATFNANEAVATDIDDV